MTTSSLAVREKEECATVAQPSLADLTTACTEMDGEVLGEFVERNWDTAVGNVSGLMYLVKEMKRRFKNLDRKKQVNGEYRTIRGFRSFKKWFASFTGKSERVGYYLLETEEKKHKRNAARRTTEKKKEKDTPSATFVAHCNAAKKKLAEIQRQTVQSVPFKDAEERDRKLKPLHAQINSTINEVLGEFLALVAPDGYEIVQGDTGKFYLTEKDGDEPEPPSPEDKKAKRLPKVHAANNGRLICNASRTPTEDDVNKGGDYSRVTCKNCWLLID